MKAVLYLCLLILMGCTAQAVSPSPTSPIASPSPSTPSQPPVSRFKLTLTLSSPEDLKVREGDTVAAGQILSDRTHDRQKLEAQKAQLGIQLERLQQSPTRPLPPKRIPDVAALPAPSFLEQQAEIDRHALLLEKANREKWNQQRLIDGLNGLEALPASTLAHESEKLKSAEQAEQQAAAELDLAKGKLSQAKQHYAREEYLYSLELSKREIDIQRQGLEYQRQLQEWERATRDRSYQIAQLTTQLQSLDTQLQQLSVVRSPYSGKIQRVKFTGQSNQVLTVELTLLTDNLRSRPSSTAPRTNPTPSPGGTSRPQRSE